MTKKILFISATSRNEGKTTCSLGILDAYRNVAGSVGFIKPVGQRYVIIDGQTIDEDAVLVHQVCGMHCSMKDMSPVAIDRNFTRRFLDADHKGTLAPLKEAIKASFARVARDNDLVVVEGTGHAGVGSVFDLCNACVARLLDAKVLIVAPGGIGRSVDEVALNHALYERENVPVIGVIANKVDPNKLDQTRVYLGRALSRRGLKLLGVIPYSPKLTWPSVAQVAEAMHARILNGRQSLSNKVSELVVGAMTARNAVKHIKDKALLIVPGDRDDVVLAALAAEQLRRDLKLAGLILTGGIQLAVQTRELIMRTDLPILSVDMPTYEAASRLHDITVKIQGGDTEKIGLAAALVKRHVDLDTLWNLL